MTELLVMAEAAAKSSGTVLITGETGVGKGVVARYIHSQSSRRRAAFVGVNCAGLTEARLEAELFGHIDGDTTSACPDRRGKFRLAHRGTLFLDEIGDMSLRTQARRLRLLEKAGTQAGTPDRPHAHLDVRVVAATNRKLEDLVSAGQFREDLLQRFRLIHLHVPPLRERPEDVHVLMRHFLARSGRELSFTDDALRTLLRYGWPGNVRELMNTIEQLVCLSPGAVVGVQHLPLSMRTGPGLITTFDDGRQVADELYETLTRQGGSFWEHVYPGLLAHDITRDDLRELVRRGLRESQGHYRTLFALFGISSRDSGRFMNVLAAQECAIGIDQFRRALRAADGEAATGPLSVADPKPRLH